MISPVEEVLQGQSSVVAFDGCKLLPEDAHADRVIARYAKAFGAGKDVIVVTVNDEVFQVLSAHEILGVLLMGNIKAVFSVPRELWETIGPKLHREQGVHVYMVKPY